MSGVHVRVEQRLQFLIDVPDRWVYGVADVCHCLVYEASVVAH
jgi:hypothetical protein